MAKNFVIVGLGNPGEEYEQTRHNVGRIVLEQFRKVYELAEWESDKKTQSKVTKGKVERIGVLLMQPETFMNNSGKSVGAVSPTLLGRKITKGKKFYENLIIVHDDIDLPIGTLRVSYNRGPGGHNGLKSVVKVLGSEAFTRVRVGVSKVTPSGKLKKPIGEDAVIDLILGKFSKAESEEFKKIAKRAAEALTAIITEGRDRAMGEYNRS
ncbi:MAG: aminoacyl-tRNA hydrolase [Candidatus Paceibacterota bacterium]|jgi:PTH1 family peptidyl-tRNA hydrolase